MYPIDQIISSQRWQWMKSEWAQGNYQRALLTLFNGMPDITYPWHEKDKNGNELPLGEPSYNRLLDIAVEKWGNYNDLRNWKNVVWREFWHFIQGCVWFPLHYLGYWIVEKLFHGYGWIGFLIAWSWLVYETSRKEFYEDVQGDGRLNAKNFIDWIVRLLPGFIFLSSWWW